MKHKKQFWLLILMVTFTFTAKSNDVVGFDVMKFKNDKEASITVLKKKEIRKLSRKYPGAEIGEQIENKLYPAFENFNREYGRRLCDLAFSNKMNEIFAIANVDSDNLNYLTLIKLARINNTIDDLFFDILKNAQYDILLLTKAETETRIPSYNTLNNKFVKNNDLEKLYKDFKVWPDNKTSCTRDVYNEFRQNIKDGKNIGISDLLSLHTEAFNQGHITLETLHKLSVLHRLKSFKYPISVNKYFDIIQKSKNILIPENRDDNGEEALLFSTFPTQILNKRSRLTRRKSLYYKYSKTQIVMMAQVLRKSARRMGADPDYSLSRAQIELTFDYEAGADSERNYVEVYELSMQDQYSLARKLLRNDMRELSKINSFASKKLNYKDIIMAALETGYITHLDLEQVLKYDDIFNPKRLSPWGKFKLFSSEMVGRSTFFLPAPFNIAGSIALIFIESFVKKPQQNGAYHENASSLIN